MQVAKLSPSQFSIAFRTEKQCRNYLLKTKHLNGFHCRKCNHSEYYEVEHRGGSWMCQACGYQESAKASTIMHRSKLPLLLWFKAIYEITVTKGGVAALELQYKLGVKNYHPVWLMLHKIRRAMGLRDEKYTLKDYVELDLAVFGKRITGTQSKVYIAVESKPTKGEKLIVGYAKARVVSRGDKENVNAFSTLILEPLTEIKTDGGSELQVLENDTDFVVNSLVMKGCKHKMDKHLPWINTLISNIKAALIGTFHGVSPEYLQQYLDEYIYRFNRRWCRNQLPLRVLNACIYAGAPMMLYSN